MLPEKLTLLDDFEPHEAALNMALDEVLLRQAEGVLVRFYRWARPAVSLGYFGDADEVAREWPGRDPVRRWTGGGVVPHGEDFTWSLIAPRGAALAEMPAPECYRRLHQAVAQAWGGEARLAARAGARVSAACFENPAVSDVLVEGRKAAGGAQRRTARGLLHQGSVQGADAGFGERLLGALGARVERRGLRVEEREAGEELARTRYGTEAWLRRFPPRRANVAGAWPT